MTLPPPITSRTNERVRALRRALDGTAAEPGDLVGIEGAILLGEAARSGFHFETVFVREGEEHLLEDLGLDPANVDSWAVLAAPVFDGALSTRTPQALAATTYIRPPALERRVPGVTLVLAGLQDPGNVGTLVRSAEAFGAARILLTPGTVNPWSPKAMRASAGSIFRMPVRRGELPAIAAWLREVGGPVFAAMPGQGSGRLDLEVPCALLIGNEGAGLSPELLALANRHLSIPAAVESLNAAVAGSILLYEAMRRSRTAGAS